MTTQDGIKIKLTNEIIIALAIPLASALIAWGILVNQVLDQGAQITIINTKLDTVANNVATIDGELKTRSIESVTLK